MDALKSTMRGATLRWRYRNPRINALARNAIDGPKPTVPADWLTQPAVKELGAAYAAWLLAPPYWASQIHRALLAAAALALLAGVLYAGVVPLDLVVGEHASQWAILCTLVLMVLSLNHAAKQHGPTEPISSSAYAAARDRLRISTDDQVTILSLPGVLLLAMVLLVDGGVLGVSMARSFSGMLTPGLALVVAFAWGATSAVILWKLAIHAAKESRVCQVRAAMRQLDGSSHEIDKQRVRRFIDSVGSRIGFNLGAAVPVARRVTLFVVVFVLAAASVGLRVARAPQAEVVPTGGENGSFAATIERSADIELPPAEPPREPMAAEPTNEGPARWGGLGANATALLAALVLSMVVLISTLALFWTLAGATCIDVTDSPRDHAVVNRFDGVVAVTAFNRRHLQNVTAALDGRLQTLARSLESAKAHLSPSEARTWLPMRLNAADVLAAALRSPEAAYCRDVAPMA